MYIYIYIYTYIYLYIFIHIYICIYFYACVCGRGPQTPPFIYSDVLFILSNRSVFLLARWLCHRQQLPGTVLPSPLPTTGPPPSQATHHGTTTLSGYPPRDHHPLLYPPRDHHPLLYPPRDHHPLRLPTTGPPPSQATHHGTTTVTVSRSEPPHSSTLLK